MSFIGAVILTLAISWGVMAPLMSCLFANINNDAPANFWMQKANSKFSPSVELATLSQHPSPTHNIKLLSF
jgi:hypothetical protein